MFVALSQLSSMLSPVAPSSSSPTTARRLRIGNGNDARRRRLRIGSNDTTTMRVNQGQRMCILIFILFF
jgi:hypothetical protein